MKVKKIPMRTCVVTREKYDKRELIRIVKDKDGHVEIDLTGKKNGHGAYMKLSKEVIEMAKKNKSLDRALETNISEQIYEELEKLVESK